MASFIRKSNSSTAAAAAAPATPAATTSSSSSSIAVPDSPPVAVRHANDTDVQVSFLSHKPSKIQRTLGLSVEQLRRVKHLHAIGMTDWEYEAQIADGRGLMIDTSCHMTSSMSTSSSTTPTPPLSISTTMNGTHSSSGAATTLSTGTRSPPQGRSPPSSSSSSSANHNHNHGNGGNNGAQLQSIRQSPSRTIRTLSPTTSTAAANRHHGTPAYAIPLPSMMAMTGAGAGTATTTSMNRSNTSPSSITAVLSPDSLTLSPISSNHSSSIYGNDHGHGHTSYYSSSGGALSPSSKSSVQRPLITPSSSPPPIGDDSRSPSYSPSHSPRSRLLPDAPLLRPTMHHGGDLPFLPLLHPYHESSNSSSSSSVSSASSSMVPSFLLPPPASTLSLYDSEVSPSSASQSSHMNDGGHNHGHTSSPSVGDSSENHTMMVSSPGGSHAHLTPLVIPPLAVNTVHTTFPSLSINAPSPSVQSSSLSLSLSSSSSWAASGNHPISPPPSHLVNGSPSRSGSNRNSLVGGMGPLLPPLERFNAFGTVGTTSTGTGMVSPQRSRSNTMTHTTSSNGHSNGSGSNSGHNSGGTSPNPSNRLSVGPLSPLNILSAHNSASPREATLTSPTTTHSSLSPSPNNHSHSHAHNHGGSNMSVAAAAAVAVLNASAAATVSRTPRRLSPLTGNGPRLSASGSFVSLPPVHHPSTAAPPPPTTATTGTSNGHHSQNTSHHNSNAPSPVGSHGSSASNSASRGESLLATAGSATDEDFWEEPTGLLTIHTAHHSHTAGHGGHHNHGHGHGHPISPMGIPTGSFDDIDSNTSNSAQPMSGGSSGSNDTPSSISHSYGGTGSVLTTGGTPNSSGNRHTSHVTNRRHTRSSSFVLAAPPVMIGQSAQTGLPLSRHSAQRRADIAMTSPLPSTRTTSGSHSSGNGNSNNSNSNGVEYDSNPTIASIPIPIPLPQSQSISVSSRSSLTRGLADRLSSSLSISSSNDRQPSHGHIGYHHHQQQHHNGHTHNNGGNGNGHKRHPSNGVLPPLLNIARSPSMNTLITVSNGRISPSSATSPLMNSLAHYMSPTSPMDPSVSS